MDYILLSTSLLLIGCCIALLIVNQKLLKANRYMLDMLKDMQRDISFYENAVNMLTMSIKDKRMHEALLNASADAEFYVKGLYEEVRKLIENNNSKDAPSNPS